MALDESVAGNLAAQHVSDHNALHVRYNDGGWAAWTSVTGGVGFQNSWVDWGSLQIAQYRKHIDGMIQVRGVVKSGTSGSVIFTLPTGYRPPLILMFASLDGGNADVQTTVTNGGAVTAAAANNAVYTLDMLFDSTGGS